MTKPLSQSATFSALENRMDSAETAIVTQSNAAGVTYNRGLAHSVPHSLGKLRDNDAANLFEWFDDSDIIAFQNYTYGVDLTTKINNAMAESYAHQKNLMVPNGGALVTTLVLPGASTTRQQAWRMYGQGPGEIFAQYGSNFTAGALFKSVTDAQVIKYVQDSPNTGGGTLEIDHLTFVGNTTSAYVVDLQSGYEASSFHHNNIIQRGTGGGFKGDLIGASDIYQNYAINKDWATLGLGAARTGIAWLFQPTINQGGAIFRTNHAKGWHDAYVCGGGTGNPILTIYTGLNEVSNCYNGYTVASGCGHTIIEKGYFEGVDGGTAIINHGGYTRILDNNLLPGATIQIDDSDSGTIATVIQNNTISLGSVANSIGVKINAAASYPGQTRKVVTDNYIPFSGSGGSIAGVVGIQISGNTSGIDYYGNQFTPINWVGGAGTVAISDLTTSGLGGTGQQGTNGLTEVINGNSLYTKLAQGAIGLGVPENALADAAVSSGVLTLGQGSYFVLTLTGATNITSLAAAAGKTTQGDIIIINATNANPTFKQGNNIKLSGSVDFTPGANGAMIGFISIGTVSAIPVVKELFRTSY